MSEIRAVTNLFSNIFATVVIARWMGEIDDDERLNRVLDGAADDEPWQGPQGQTLQRGVPG
jgi:Na+/H+-dicarboxylate symporter